ncbi:MAG TPA: S53 family peptidase [Solirubrobacteraceae bacterium]|jgi:hypothetical protein|nr:S53 family peptidase [Solirubrobacteraceae bacterium]
MRCAAAASCALPAACTLALVVAQGAQARWTAIAARPSGVQPYFACAAGDARPQCQLIEDPTRGVARRGPVREGAITIGPEQQVSPALEGSGVEGGYSPADLRLAYGLPSSSNGAGQTIAVVDAFDDPNAESDLAAYRAEYGLAPCIASTGCFRKVDQRGGIAYPEANASWAGEISLDLDMVSAICPNCHILLVEADTNEATDLAAAEDQAVAQGATEISNSFGGRVPSQPPQIAAAFDHPGIPITAGGGDRGYGANSPASSPHVIAVGGTRLVHAGTARGWSESVWYSTAGGEVHGTGSGCSAEAKPPWQGDSGCPYRTTNDVAAVADPNTPVSVYDSYQTGSPWRLAGGTSVATPIVAASMALADAYTRSFDGAQALYLEAAANGTGVLDDVTVGSNGSCGSYLCEARIGYDGPTGLGSIYGAPSVSPGQVHPPPAVQTKTASAITAISATLNASVNPNGAPVTRCRFYFGSSEAFTPCASLPEAGNSPVAVSASLFDLLPGTAYRYRIVASNASGTSSGEIVTVTTLGAVQGGPALPIESPPASSPPQQPRAKLAALYATLADAALAARRSGIVRVKVSCPPQKHACVGAVTLRTARAVVVRVRGHRSSKRVVTLATATFRISGGHTELLTLRLSKAARALLAQSHTLHALAVVDEHHHASRATVTIRLSQPVKR